MPSGRLVAVGDIHGDLDALVRILRGLALVDAAGDWCGCQDHLVLLGDLNDRGSDSVETMSYVMRLQQQAAGCGSELTALLGNHELMAVQGDFRYVRPAEVLAWEGYWYGHAHGLHAIYRHHSPWARWMRTRPAMLAVGEVLFVHAGLPADLLDIDPANANQTISDWVSHFQGAGNEPAEDTLCLVVPDGQGPLWCGAYRLADGHVSEELPQPAALQACLGRLGCTVMVVGHRPTARADFRIAYPHPVLGPLVALIDTGISRHYNGRLSALVLRAGSQPQPLYFDRGESDLALTWQLRAHFRRWADAQAQAQASE